MKSYKILVLLIPMLLLAHASARAYEQTTFNEQGMMVRTAPIAQVQARLHDESQKKAKAAPAETMESPLSKATPDFSLLKDYVTLKQRDLNESEYEFIQAQIKFSVEETMKLSEFLANHSNLKNETVLNHTNKSHQSGNDKQESKKSPSKDIDQKNEVESKVPTSSKYSNIKPEDQERLIAIAKSLVEQGYRNLDQALRESVTKAKNHAQEENLHEAIEAFNRAATTANAADHSSQTEVPLGSESGQSQFAESKASQALLLAKAAQVMTQNANTHPFVKKVFYQDWKNSPAYQRLQQQRQVIRQTRRPVSLKKYEVNLREMRPQGNHDISRLASEVKLDPQP